MAGEVDWVHMDEGRIHQRLAAWVFRVVVVADGGHTHQRLVVWVCLVVAVADVGHIRAVWVNMVVVVVHTLGSPLRLVA